MNRLVYGGLVGGLLALVTTAMGCGSSPCSTLAACSACDSTCQALVGQGNADACTQALNAYNQLNLCGGGTPTDMIVTTDIITPTDVPRPDTTPPDTTPPDVVIVEDEITPPPPDMTAVVVSPENVGSACTADADLRDDANCGAAMEQVCIGSGDDGTGPGFCSVIFCADDADCGAGNYCALPIDQAGTQFACVAGCTQAAGGCDTGLSCQPLLGVVSICFNPICTADADCGADGVPDPTLYCNTALSTCLTAGAAGATVGAACTDSAECTRNGACLVEATGFTGGYCTIPECDAAGDFACPADAACVAIDPSIPPVCLKTCTAPADCRTGYTCMADPNGGGSVCIPMQ